MNLRDILKMKSTRLGGCFGMVNNKGGSIKDNSRISDISLWLDDHNDCDVL